MEKLYSKFESLTEEKRKRIIDICIEEFSQNGYENASTNNIVKKAEISKGILFHYFGKKKNLYLYILDQIIDHIVGTINEQLSSLPTDIFERVFRTGLVKLKVAYKFPQEYKIMLDAFTHTPEDLEKEMKLRYEKTYTSSIPVFLKDIDTTKFREDIDKGKAIELIMLALEGVGNKYMRMFKDKTAEDMFSEMESIAKEYEDYIEILRGGVYGEGSKIATQRTVPSLS